MKKKTCRWLDSNTWGGIQILDDKIYPCCGPSEPLYDEENLDYSKISIDELLEKRRVLQKDVMEGKACIGCDQIIEKEESDIVVDKISYLSIGLFSTCNLRCKYCYFTHEQLGKKLSPKRTKLLPLVKKFADADMLKNTVDIGVAGGEPTLFEDLPETLNFLAERYSSPGFVLLSNSTLENKTKKLAEELKKVDKKLQKTLYTSIDAGTPETYKAVRGKDLFNAVCKNIINYAKKESFNNINLKYILLFDHINTSDKDVFGFLNFVKKVMLNSKNCKLSITLDCDMLSNEPFDDKMIAAAGKIHYIASKIFGINICYCGGGLVHYSKKGEERISLLEEYARKYPKLRKSFKERAYLAMFKIASFYNIIKNSFNLNKIARLIKLLGMMRD